MMNDYAVIVGIEHYKPGGLNELPGAIHDAQDFYDWVTSPEGGKVKENNCKLLKSQAELTSVLLNQIEDEINEKCSSAQENLDGGRFYFFFSGHGLGVNSNETALVPTDWMEGLPRAMAADSWKQSILDRGAFQEVLFFLDCCRSRKVNLSPSSRGLYNPKIHEDVEDFNDLIAMATSYLEPAFEGEIERADGKRKNGFFTTALLRAIKGEAADKDGLITFENLKNFLEKETNLVAHQFNKKQQARVNYSHKANAVFTRVDKVKNENITIHLSNVDNGPFIIENGSLDRVAEYSEKEKEWKLALPNGLYTIMDSKGNEKNIRIIIESNTSIDVEF